MQLLGNQKFGALNEQQQELLKSINDDGQRLLNITGELLNLSQVETGNIRLTVEKCSPKEVVQAAVKNVEKLAEQKNVLINTEYLAGDHDFVTADFDKTVWVMNNFLTNAVKHSFQDENIDIKVEKVDSMIQFSITDTGSGIDENITVRSSIVIFRFPESTRTEQDWDWLFPKILSKSKMAK